ncbi:predicted protein [Nematostella vectensis]|uniref:G-protein coupled receptors family 1 profile domain-containing protein n=1 Tax=Nematostella vectensis TaxID=45351 RepID=A7RVH5_NEMVE|nr:predicted protein [Nematostella vectensis]|eukprot:XP_001636641.1 predicted protein [Nematostella vectensis]
MNSSEESGKVETITRSLPMMLLALAAFAENALVLVSVARFKSLRRLPGNAFIVNLALTDVIGASVCMPLAISAVLSNRWVLGELICQFQAFLIVALSNVTFLTLFSYSVYRYFMVTSSRQPTRAVMWTRVKTALLAIWAVGLSMSVPPLGGWGRYEYIPTFYACTLDWHANKSFSVSIFIIIYFIPQAIMAFSYYRISIFVRRHKRNLLKRKKENAMNNFHSNPAINLGLSTNENTEPAENIARKDERMSNVQLPIILLEHPEEDPNKKVLFGRRFHDSGDSPDEFPLFDSLRRPSALNAVSPVLSVVDLRETFRSPCLSMGNIFLDQNEVEEDATEPVVIQNPASVSNNELPLNLSRFEKRSKPQAKVQKFVNWRRLFRETRLIKLLLFTLLAFYVCWTPFAVASFMQTVGFLEPRPPYFDVVSMWLAFSNAVCNPVIYALLNSQFKKAFSKILKRLFCCAC